MSAWVQVFLVVQRGPDPKSLHVVKFEGHPIEGSGTWAINTRDPSCRSKLIEVVDERFVSLDQAGAEQRIKELNSKR